MPHPTADLRQSPAALSVAEKLFLSRYPNWNARWESEKGIATLEGCYVCVDPAAALRLLGRVSILVEMHDWQVERLAQVRNSLLVSLPRTSRGESPPEAMLMLTAIDAYVERLLKDPQLLASPSQGTTGPDEDYPAAIERGWARAVAQARGEEPESDLDADGPQSQPVREFFAKVSKLLAVPPENAMTLIVLEPRLRHIAVCRGLLELVSRRE